MSDNTTRTLDDLLEPGATVMIAPESVDETLEFRPLTVAAVDESKFQILLDTSAPWTHQRLDGASAYVTMGDTRSNTWISLRGRLSTSTDDHLIDTLWNPFADAYFDNGRETPGITVLEVRPERGAYWSSPSGRLGSLISLAKAKLGSADESGESGPIAS